MDANELVDVISGEHSHALMLVYITLMSVECLFI